MKGGSATASITAAAVLASWSISLCTATEGVVRWGAPIVTAAAIVPQVIAAVRYRSRFWVLLVVAHSCTFAQHLTWALWPGRGTRGLGVGSNINVLWISLATVVGGTALWVGARPLLSYRPMRTPMVVAVAVATGALSTVVVTDGVIRRGGSTTALAVSSSLTVAFVLVELVAVTTVAIRLARFGRIAELLCIAAAVSVSALSAVWGMFELERTWFVPVHVSLAFLAAAALHPSAGMVGTAIEAHPVLTRVPAAPGLVVTVASAGMSASLLLGGPWPLLWGCAAVMVVGGSFALWRLGGGAFDVRRSFDRDVRNLPGLLVRGVTVEFQPVVRLSDGAVVAARAMPMWRSDRAALERLRRAAAASGLGDELDLHLIAQVARALAEMQPLSPPEGWSIGVPLQTSSLGTPRFVERIAERLEPRVSLNGVVLEFDRLPADELERQTLTRLLAKGAGCAMPVGDAPVEQLAPATVGVIDLGVATRSNRARIAEQVRRCRDAGLESIAVGVDHRHALVLGRSVRADHASGEELGPPGPLAPLLRRSLGQLV